MRLTLEQFCVANRLHHQYLIDRDLALTIMSVGFEPVPLSNGGFWLYFSSIELGSVRIGVQFDLSKKTVEIGYSPFNYYSKEKGDRGKYFGEEHSARLFKKVWKIPYSKFTQDSFFNTILKIHGTYEAILSGQFNTLYDLVIEKPTFKNLTYFVKDKGFSYPLGKGGTLLMIPSWSDDNNEEAVELVLMGISEKVIRLILPCSDPDLIISHLSQYPLW